MPKPGCKICLVAVLLSPSAIAQGIDPIPLGESLKESYSSTVAGRFYHNGHYADGISVICEMGQAVPSTEREDWYVNRPIAGLQLELRARAAIQYENGTVKSLGHIVIVKNGDVLKVFEPIGDWDSGEWDGDLLNSWPINQPEIRVFSQRHGRTGYAHFNLMDGMGFYYEYRQQTEPAYFLNDCRRIKKTDLPIYDWDVASLFETQEKEEERD